MRFESNQNPFLDRASRIWKFFEMASPHLILGVDGGLGHHLQKFLSNGGVAVVGSTRRKASLIAGNFLLDFSDATDLDKIPELRTPYETAYLCAGMANVSACEADPEASHRVNVTSTLAVVEILLRRGIFVVLLSSNLVFDGLKSYYQVYDATCPTNLYGKQKVELEQKILALPEPLRNNVAILRLGKVLNRSFDLPRRWVESLERNEVITPFRNKQLAPITDVQASRALQMLGAARKPGIFHLSATDEFNYAEFAARIAETLGFGSELVQARDDSASLGKATTHSTLENSPIFASLEKTCLLACDQYISLHLGKC